MDALAAAGLTGAAAVFGALTLLWLWSVRLRDVSIIDIFWGLGFVLLAWIYRAHGPAPSGRQLLVLALVTVWGLRLALYLFWRNRGRGEDRRYAKMRERQGAGFWWRSYFRVFLLQGVLMLVISAPLLWIEAAASPSGWRLTDALGLVLWSVGFFFEAVGDYQMARFQADPANDDEVMDRGLWAMTRHPNYFGDATLWWGYFCFALASPGGWWTLPSVLLMSFLLLKVSGVALLEKDIAERRPEYREYKKNTPAFFPRWPARWSV